MENYKQLDSFEKVLAVKGETIEQFNERTKGLDADTVGYEKVKAIAFAMNGGKHVTEGYYPWFRNPNRSVAGFSYFGYFYDVAYSIVGARHLMEDSDAAIYAGKTFPNEYSEYING